MGWKALATFSPKISRTRVFDLTRTCDDKHAFIYRRPSKWPTVIVLTAAVLIHLSAVAIAFHQESPAIFRAAIDPAIIGVYFDDDANPAAQIPIFLSNRPHRFRQPILLNPGKLVA